MGRVVSGGMRFVVCLIVSTFVLIGCSDAEESFLGSWLDGVDEPQNGTIALALLNPMDRSLPTTKGSRPSDPMT